MGSYAYKLRFALKPGQLEEVRLEGLLAFCREAQIDEVMFFVDPMNLRHVTEAEAEAWLSAIARAKPAVEALGVAVSLNPLNTLTHDSAGNRLLPDQPFRRMVDTNGTESQVAPCPLCPQWRAYIVERYRQYAALQPRTLWLEDDFRFHNHAPLEWGGCFCDAHMQLYARQAGVDRLEREAFLAGVLAPGDPHPYRQVWLDCCRTTLVELAELLEQAIHGVAPEAQVGLMSSDPSAHAAEARDWHGLMAALSGPGGEPAAIVRPHLPVYMETSGMHYAWHFHAVSMLTAALLPVYIELYPELENVPYTRYAKSARFQQYQLETALLLGSRGITLNIVDMAGNGIYPTERAEQWLQPLKPFLQAVAAMPLQQRNMQGVQVLVNEQSAYTLHAGGEAAMEGLYPQETFWSSLLSAYGIANHYVAGLPSGAEPVAISGQVLRNYTDEQIAALFAGNCVLLDGLAVEMLMERGLGGLCGAKRVRWHALQSYEQIGSNGHCAGMDHGIMRPYLSVAPCLEVEYEDGAAVVLTTVCRPDGQALFPGMAIARAGVLILPYRQENAYGLLNPQRRVLIQQFLARHSAAPLLMRVSEAPHVAVYGYRTQEEQIVAIANHSLDDVQGLELAGLPAGGEWQLYQRDCPEGRTLEAEQLEGILVMRDRIPFMSITVIRWLYPAVAAGQ